MDLQNYKPEWVPISTVDCENTQFRFRNDLNISELAESLEAEGQKFPILLWKRNTGTLQLISGFRRINAAKQLNWENILAIALPETEINEEQALKLNFIENVERKTLTDLDLVYTCAKLKSNGKSNRLIGKLISKGEASVRRYMMIADAPREIHTAVMERRLSLRQAEEMAKNNWEKPSAGLEPLSERMYVKDNKTGFDIVLKLRPQTDNIDSAITFLKSQIQRLEAIKKARQAQIAEIKGKLSKLEITGPSSVSFGKTITLEVTGYDDAGNKLSVAGTGIIKVSWVSDNKTSGIISEVKGETITFTAKAIPGTCWVKADCELQPGTSVQKTKLRKLITVGA